MGDFILGAFSHPPKHGKKHVKGGLNTALTFSQTAYREESKRPATLEGFQYDTQLSNKRNAVYHSPTENRVIVAFRGTDFTDPTDVFDDIRIATGTFAGDPRIKKGKEITKQASDKYGVPIKQVELTGHSLGGRVAQAVGEHFDSNRVTAVNPGSSPIDIVHPSAGSGFGRTFTTGTDPVSITNTVVNPSAVRFRIQSTVEPHGLGAFGDQITKTGHG